MAQLWTTGAAHFWLGVGDSLGQASTKPAYLGTCEGSPNIEVLPQYKDVQEDIAGEVPTDVCYMGRRATITADFTRWNERTYEKAASVNPFSTNLLVDGNRPQLGYDFDTDIGTLILREGYSYQLFIAFPFQRKDKFRDMPPGYRFPCAFLDRESLYSLGSRPRKIRLVWHALRQPNPYTRTEKPQQTTSLSSKKMVDEVDPDLTDPVARQRAIAELAKQKLEEARAAREAQKNVIKGIYYVLYDFKLPADLKIE